MRSLSSCMLVSVEQPTIPNRREKRRRRSMEQVHPLGRCLILSFAMSLIKLGEFLTILLGVYVLIARISYYFRTEPKGL
jgi:hypothetical protein